ncbi:ribbon-helix-helix domain-containing protein [Aquisediminimonas sediminicola]|uniref:ribbon-helix-helix domain-containing protein n=1 Tax=Alteraquisediminimonas sediminicola TaxID=2676787 RepID=UPI002484750C|nr:ribbon-helix-helix domain-containing protein [Aquisediminimonas sediminicola]
MIVTTGGFDWLAGPAKHSVMIAGHSTSISLEPLFWESLCRAAQLRALPVNALIAQIDVLRMEHPDPPNLASAIRLWLLREESATTG